MAPIGGESGPRQLADPPQAAVILCLLLLGGSVVALTLRYRGVLMPLWFVIPYVAVTVALLAYGRAGAYGRVTSAEIRYWSDFMPFLTLAIGLALMPVPVCRPCCGHGRRRRLPHHLVTGRRGVPRGLRGRLGPVDGRVRPAVAREL